MKPLPECRLYTFIDTGHLAGRPVGLLAQQLCDGGADLIQLRAKSSSLDEIRRMAGLIRAVTARAGVRLVINDHPAIAVGSGADLCHLGQEDFVGEAGNQMARLRSRHPGLGVGLSTHAPAEALRAVATDVDYVAVGPVYSTGTKPTARPVTLDYVRWAAANLTLPWFAIGGITMSNLGEVLDAGARRIAVLSAILDAPNVVESCQRFRDRLLSVAK